MASDQNREIADKLEEVAQLLEEQGASRFRVTAYRSAANTLRRLERPVGKIHEENGIKGLDALPGVGETIARAIVDVLLHGRLAMLERIRGEIDPEALLATVPGIGGGLARRLHHDLGIESLEDLEAAAHNGRLGTVVGMGPKRIAGIRDSLAHRLARVRRSPGAPESHTEPNVAEILDVDREYREGAAAGNLRLIAPKRFNPERTFWLPVLHTNRGDRHYTALFSNTALAHELGKTNDWVIIYCDDGRVEGQYTVVTVARGRMKGRRIVRGRDQECEDHYKDMPTEARSLSV